MSASETQKLKPYCSIIQLNFVSPFLRTWVWGFVCLFKNMTRRNAWKILHIHLLPSKQSHIECFTMGQESYLYVIDYKIICCFTESSFRVKVEEYALRIPPVSSQIATCINPFLPDACEIYREDTHDQTCKSRKHHSSIWWKIFIKTTVPPTVC